MYQYLPVEHYRYLVGICLISVDDVVSAMLTLHQVCP